jgi:hypothetical protein
MEFSYKLTEDDFIRGVRLERKASSRSSLKTALFWMSIMGGLMILFASIRPGDHQAPDSTSAAVFSSAQPSPTTLAGKTAALLQQVGPFLVIAGLWILLVKGLVPLRLRYLYRKDPRMQAYFVVELTGDSISTYNAAGTSSRSAWNVYDGWCECEGIIVLMFHSGAYSIMSLAGLSPLQQDDVRGILTAALPRK